MNTCEEIRQEIDKQIESMTYLKEHPEVAKHTIMHETGEYCRGALNMLNYLKTYMEHIK